MKRLNKNIAIFSSILVLFIASVLLFIQKSYPFFDHVVYYCQSFINSSMIQVPQFIRYIPFVIILSFLFFILVRTIVLYIRVRGFKQGISVRSHTGRVKSLVNKLSLEEKTIVVKSNKKFAFCLGIREPKIYISTGLTSSLSLSELEAVLRHEQYHLENYDNLTMTIVTAVYSLLPFFPLLGDIISRYKIDREIKADRFAVKQLGNSQSLVSALRKLLQYPQYEKLAVAAFANSDSLEPRINALTNRKYSRNNFEIKNIFISLASFIVIASIFVFPVYAEEIHHEEHDVVMVCAAGKCMNSCRSEKNLNILYSEAPSSTNVSQTKSSHPVSSNR